MNLLKRIKKKDLKEKNENLYIRIYIYISDKNIKLGKEFINI